MDYDLFYVIHKQIVVTSLSAVWEMNAVIRVNLEVTLIWISGTVYSHCLATGLLSK